MNSELADLQRKWFDINSDTVIELDGDKLTIDTGYYSEKYKVELVTEGDLTYLKNRDDDGFGDMSNLYIGSDGTMIADEMILDADGHHYHFVREEQLEAERTVVDVSKDMPKTIDSREIEEFSLNLTIDGVYYDIDEDWPHGVFSWTMERLEDGTYDMMVDIMGPSYIALRCQENVDAAFAEGLADRIVSLDLPSLNGYYKENNVRSHSYYLSVRYTSGEKLTIGASGDAADTCPFDVNALMEYVKELALAKGQGGY